MSSISIIHLRKDQISEIKKYYKSFGFNHLNFDWHTFYSNFTGVFHHSYIPEDLYYTKIEPALNRLELFPAFVDKNFLSRIFFDVKQPETIVKNINGYYYGKDGILIDLNEAANLCAKSEKFIIKPSLDSGGGKNVSLIQRDKADLELFKKQILSVLTKYNKDFIVQEVIAQHEALRSLNETSVNIIRVLSYLSVEGPEILSAYIRSGRLGAINDHASTGGIYLGFSKDYKLFGIAYDDKFKKYSAMDNGLVFKDLELPLDQIYKTVEKLHPQMSHFKLISWDFAIDKEEEVVLIEFNVKWQEIMDYQFTYAKPPFGAFDKEILEETRKYWKGRHMALGINSSLSEYRT